MAYPFMRMPTLGEFIRQAVELHGATLRQSKGVVLGPDGRKTSPRFLARKVGDKTLHVVLPDITDETGLTPTNLRHLADRLGIDVSLYPGLKLTENGFEYDDPPKNLH